MTFPFQTILVTTDFSGTGNSAVPVASRLAKDHGARVILLHVIEGAGLPSPLYAHYYNLPSPEQIKQAEVRACGELARLLPTDARDLGHEVLVRQGEPSTEIVRAAKDNQASLLVISSHGRTGLKHFLLGSVAERVLRHASCPVLVMR